MMELLKSIPVLFLMLSVAFVGCTQQEDRNADNDADSTVTKSDQNAGAYNSNTEEQSNIAIAVINPTAGNNAKGTVTFENTSNGVDVHAEFSGLPEGKHGFHIHLYGDCSADDGTSAGTHFNFEGSSKNPPTDIDRITGNLGVLTAGADGSATTDTTISNATLSGAKSIIGRGVIVHAKGNDPSQPPIGAAGARLGCGVIGHANPETMEMMENEKMNEGN